MTIANPQDDDDYRIRETKSRYESLNEQIAYQRKQGNQKVANLLVAELNKSRSERIHMLEYEIEWVANDNLTADKSATFKEIQKYGSRKKEISSLVEKMKQENIQFRLDSSIDVCYHL